MSYTNELYYSELSGTERTAADVDVVCLARIISGICF